MLSLLKFGTFIKLANLVAAEGITVVIDTGSEMGEVGEFARRCDLHATIRSVTATEALAQVFEDFDIYDGPIDLFLSAVLPKLTGKTALFILADPRHADLIEPYAKDERWFTFQAIA